MRPTSTLADDASILPTFFGELYFLFWGHSEARAAVLRMRSLFSERPIIPRALSGRRPSQGSEQRDERSEDD